MKKTAPDDRRCDAIADMTFQRCAKHALWFRDGRQVCHVHFHKPDIEYAADSFDRVGAYAKAIALALGDALVNDR
jgi:hypothetical protein